MYPYDTTATPPAPIVPLTVFPPPGVRADPIVLNALADTGADHTCLPSQVMYALNLLPNGMVSISGATGSGTCYQYSVDLEFHNRRFPACTVVELPFLTQALLGRDLMNFYRLEFNGPSNYLTVL
jgi:hypothetical protein